MRARRAVGLGALGGVFAIEAALAVGAAGHPFAVVPPVTLGGRPDWLTGPLRGLDWYIMGTKDFRVALAGLFVAYLAILACCDALRPKWVLYGAVAAQLPFILGPPLLSPDVMSYLSFGWLGAEHGLSPYAVGPDAVASNPWLPFHEWDHLQTPYGPLFTALSYPIASLGVGVAFWLMKTLMVAAAVACVLLVWHCALERGVDARRAVTFVALNPLWLAADVGGFHNDLLMLALVVAGLLWVVRGRDARGIAAILTAAAVKFTGVIALPFAVLGARRRSRAFATAGLVGAALVGASFAAFGTHLLTGVKVAADNTNVYRSPVSGPNAVAHVIGHSGSVKGIAAALLSVAAVLVLVLMWRTWHGADWVTAAGWATLCILVASTYLAEWYVAWLLPLAALGKSRRLRAAAVGLTAVVVALPKFVYA
ncbi:MAG: alpha,6-mannosyltransferase [Thermoleophilaceae bacterium]|nr:alpha,6-mannosyltransferase [Thermoleophilaceae bacterium]